MCAFPTLGASQGGVKRTAFLKAPSFLSRVLPSTLRINVGSHSLKRRANAWDRRGGETETAGAATR